jgi:hypothetical protein
MHRVQQIHTNADGLLGDVQPLWRYVSFKAAIPYLKGKVFIPTVEQLCKSDPFEGSLAFETLSLTPSFKQAFKEHYGSQACAVANWIRDKLCTDEERQRMEQYKGTDNYRAKILRQRYLEFLRKTRYVWCWFGSGIESALMWNTYGRDGMAVGTTVGRLRSALEKSGRDFVYGQMVYRDLDLFNADSAVDRRLLTMPHFFKRREYRDEREVRFATTGPGSVLTLDLPPADWITEIRLHPRLAKGEVVGLRRNDGRRIGRL